MQIIIKKKTLDLNLLKRKSPGFTLIELLVALTILVVLITIAFAIYNIYINKAKIAIAESSLVNARDNLESYYADKAKYPDSIDFTSCIDEQSHAVFSPAFCEQLKRDLSSIENYTSNTTSYTLSGHARDDKSTLITLTPKNITKQGD
jgi:prepilin-type N-terminal cleavage/methylation domain-containing protein